MEIAVVWVLRIVFLCVLAAFTHWNFIRYHNHKKNFNAVARTLQRQALWFSVGVLFISANGLNAIYAGVFNSLPSHCQYDSHHCGIIELYDPVFSYDDDKCMDDLKSYVTTRGQLRVVRDFMLINIVSYAVFSSKLLAVSHQGKYPLILMRLALIALYVGLAFTLLVAYTDPLIFVQKWRLANDTLELGIFLFCFILLAANLIQLYCGRGELEWKKCFFKDADGTNIDMQLLIEIA
jgi:hypothetical protein